MNYPGTPVNCGKRPLDVTLYPLHNVGMGKTESSLKLPTDQPERALARKYGGLIAGVDEAGRGPWAGPVVAAAVIFHSPVPPGITDSKKLTAAAREILFDQVQTCAFVGVGISEVALIDEINIYHATHTAMAHAIAALPVAPDAALIDGNRCPKLKIPAEALVGGDALSLSIAAASIIAKVTRDRIMCALALEFPNYGFDQHKGYGTRAHALALNAHGVCNQHRRSFRPVFQRELRSLSECTAS